MKITAWPPQAAAREIRLVNCFTFTSVDSRESHKVPEAASAMIHAEESPLACSLAFAMTSARKRQYQSVNQPIRT